MFRATTNKCVSSNKKRRTKTYSMINDKAHAIKVAKIEHKHDFEALGMNEAVFDFNTIARAYGLNQTRL